MSLIVMSVYPLFQFVKDEKTSLPLKNM